MFGWTSGRAALHSRTGPAQAERGARALAGCAFVAVTGCQSHYSFEVREGSVSAEVEARGEQLIVRNVVMREAGEQ